MKRDENEKKIKLPKFLQKEKFCEGLEDGINGSQCRYANIYRIILFSSVLTIIFLFLFNFILFLAGGFSYESSFSILFGIGIFIILVCLVLIVISSFFLLSNIYSKISFIVSMILLGAFIIYLMVIHF